MCPPWLFMSSDKADRALSARNPHCRERGARIKHLDSVAPFAGACYEKASGAASREHGLDVPGVGWVQQEKGFSGAN